MKILVSNDDGVYARGIAVLTAALAKNHEVIVAAPSMERSGASHSITFAVPLVASRVEIPGIEGIETYSITGTPADCVKLGCCNLAKNIDIVVTGINHGSNMGTDVLYSGTVSAAREAVSLGVPAVAVSLDSHDPINLEAAADAACAAIGHIAKNPLPKGIILNINVPELPSEKIRGAKLGKLNLTADTRPYEQREDPFGRAYYWLPNRDMRLAPPEGSDEYLVRNGYIAITPILFCPMLDTDLDYFLDIASKLI